MKRTTLLSGFFVLLGLATLIGLPAASYARTPNFVDQSDSFISYSLGYEYSEGQFEPINGSTTEDTSLSYNLSTVQVSLRPTYFTQLYGIVGLERNNLEDTSTEKGTVTGGGAQIILDYNQNMYLKAIGSYLVHEELDISGSNTSIKFKQDWQGGFLLGRTVDQRDEKAYTSYYNAYMGVLYSDRQAEITEAGTTTEVEQAQANGASIVAGVNWRYSPNVRIEAEGEAGTMTSGALRLTYTF